VRAHLEGRPAVRQTGSLILAHAFAGAHPANDPACDPQAQTAQIVAGYFASLADHPAGEEVPPADPPTQPESMK
jgi:hypothetical protein